MRIRLMHCQLLESLSVPKRSGIATGCPKHLLETQYILQPHWSNEALSNSGSTAGLVTLYCRAEAAPVTVILYVMYSLQLQQRVFEALQEHLELFTQRTSPAETASTGSLGDRASAKSLAAIGSRANTDAATRNV